MATSYLDKTGLTHLWGKIKDKIPTKTSELTNDSDFVTSTQLDGKVDIAQGSSNANKYLATNSSGNVITQELPTASSTVLGAVKPVTKTVDMTQAVGVDANGLLYTNASAQSDWNENDSTDPAYVLNRPAIRAGDGKNSVMIGQIEQDESYAAIYHLTFDYPSGATNTITFTTEDDLSELDNITNTKLKKLLCYIEYTYTDISSGENYSSHSYLDIADINTVTSTIIFKEILPKPSSACTYSSVSATLYYSYKLNKGSMSVTEGKGSATGSYSHAEGFYTRAIGSDSHAEGQFTTASGLASHSEGNFTIASGGYSHATGASTIASGAWSFAGGYGSVASGKYSNAFGCFGYFNQKIKLNGDANATTYTISSGQIRVPNTNYVIDGKVSSVKTSFSSQQAIIAATIDENNYLTSLTFDITLDKLNAVSQEYYLLLPTKASGDFSHAEGYATQSEGMASHAEGYGSLASGNYSHTEGFNTIANHKSQHVFGEYNAEDSSTAAATARGNYVEIVGKGTSDSARSNARTLDWSGNEVLAGKLTVGTGPTENMDVATKQYVDAATAGISPNLSGLTDTNITSPANGQVLKYDSTSSKWVNGDAEDVFVITVTRSGSYGNYTYASDKTFNELKTAYNNGEKCIISYQGSSSVIDQRLDLVYHNTSAIESFGFYGAIGYTNSTINEYYAYYGSSAFHFYEYTVGSTGLNKSFFAGLSGIAKSNGTTGIEKWPLTARQAYSEGELFWQNYNVLAKAKTNIASGETLTEGTNYEVTTIANELANMTPDLAGLTDTTISSPATGQILTYDGTTSKWVNTTSPYMTASQVNELIAVALAEYGDGDTASYGFEDASEVSY